MLLLLTVVFRGDHDTTLSDHCFSTDALCSCFTIKAMMFEHFYERILVHKCNYFCRNSCLKRVYESNLKFYWYSQIFLGKRFFLIYSSRRNAWSNQFSLTSLTLDGINIFTELMSNMISLDCFWISLIIVRLNASFPPFSWSSGFLLWIALLYSWPILIFAYLSLIDV